MISLNKAYRTGNEIKYIGQAMENQTSGNGPFTKKCQQVFQERYKFSKTLLTTSCTDALEMAAILLNIKAGDEIIMPSFTFVSTANAFILRGAKVVFADSLPDHPNVDVSKLEGLINTRTKAIVVVHYAGMAVDMDPLMTLANKHNIFVIEDAAQAIDSYYKSRPLGGIGHLGCLSFHDTKNVISGEGGMLIINDKRFLERAEIIWEKGTNRSAFIRGEVDKYGWVDVGSSFLPSEIIAAFLYAQLEAIDFIHAKRKEKWTYYYENLQSVHTKFNVDLPVVPFSTQHNAHIFYLVCNNGFERDYLIKTLKNEGIQASFHYPPLHLSNFNLRTNAPKVLPNALKFSEQLIRLPLYVELTQGEQDFVIKTITDALSNFHSSPEFENLKKSKNYSLSQSGSLK